MAPAAVETPVALIEGAEYLRSGCAACGGCCAMHIPITDVDVRRLMDGTGLPAERIVKFVPATEFADPTDDCFTWIDFSRLGRRVMCLRETEGRCIFLQNNRCGVYPVRPVTCRVHPLLVETDHQDRLSRIEINTESPCPNRAQGDTCPTEVLQLERQSTKEDKAYEDKVLCWNRRFRHGLTRDFLAFTGLIEA